MLTFLGYSIAAIGTLAMAACACAGAASKQLKQIENETENN